MNSQKNIILDGRPGWGSLKEIHERVKSRNIKPLKVRPLLKPVSRFPLFCINCKTELEGRRVKFCSDRCNYNYRNNLRFNKQTKFNAADIRRKITLEKKYDQRKLNSPSKSKKYKTNVYRVNSIEELDKTYKELL